jgi:hypothetical protein
VKGVLHNVVRDLQVLGNLSHVIALISQNKNSLTSFRRKFFVSGHFEPVIEPTNADATSLKKASFISSLISTTVEVMAVVLVVVAVEVVAVVLVVVTVVLEVLVVV